MKKLLLSLAVATMGLTASAQVYLLGGADGLTWDLPGMEVQGENNVYTFNLVNAVNFKVSTAYATDWDTYDAAAYATGNVSFSADQVSKAGGQTLPVVPWGENQGLPYQGDYTITLDLNNMTMTAYTSTPVPTEAPAVYIRGGMNDWGSLPIWKFNYSAKEDMYYFICQGETAINAGIEFKIADANWGNINFTSGGMVSPTDAGTKVDLLFNNPANMKVSSTFNGIIYFKNKGIYDPNAWAIFQSNVFTYDPMVKVGEIMAEEGEAVYYNLQGQKVANPDRGIFVKVVNGKASKVVK